MSSQKSQRKEYGKVVTRSITIREKIWNKARHKAIDEAPKGSLSNVISEFLRLWLDGEIDLPEPEEEQQD